MNMDLESAATIAAISVGVAGIGWLAKKSSWKWDDPIAEGLAKAWRVFRGNAPKVLLVGLVGLGLGCGTFSYKLPGGILGLRFCPPAEHTATRTVRSLPGVDTVLAAIELESGCAEIGQAPGE